jgi:hypothetical protein
MLYVPRHLPNKLEYKVVKLYFSPLSVTDDKQRDRNHPFSSSYSAGRAIWGIRAILVLYLGMLWLRADSAYRGTWYLVLGSCVSR